MSADPSASAPAAVMSPPPAGTKRTLVQRALRLLGSGMWPLKLAILVILIPYIWIGFSARPAYDDYGYAASMHETSVLACQLHWYANWGGRFTATFVQTAVVNWIGVHTVCALFPLVLLVGLTAGLGMLFSVVTANRLWHWRAAWYAVGLMLLYLLYLPVPVEGFYWLAGAVTYIGGATLGVMMLALLLWRPTETTPSDMAARRVMVALLATLAVGCSETDAMYLHLTLMTGLAMVALRHSPRWRTWLFGWLCLWPGTLVLLLAPGNRVRSKALASEGATVNLYDVVVGSAQVAVGHIATWATRPVNLLAALVVLATCLLIWRRPQTGIGRVHWGHLAFVPVMMFGGVWAVEGLSAFGLGRPALPRQQNVALLVFMVQALYGLALLAQWLRDRYPSLRGLANLRGVGRVAAGVGLQAVMALALLGSPGSTLGVVLRDIVLRVPAWALAYDRRVIAIEDAVAAGQTIVETPVMVHGPTIVGYLDIGPGDSGINASWASYYRVQQVLGVGWIDVSGLKPGTLDPPAWAGDQPPVNAVPAPASEPAPAPLAPPAPAPAGK